MHRLAATPGGWDDTKEGVVFIEQTPAPIVLLTAADTDISALHQALTRLPEGFEEIRALSLLQLQQQLTIDTYADTVLSHARLIILRILGGRAYWSYGLEVVKEVAISTGAALVVMPGDDRPDLDLMSHSTVSLSTVNRLWRYFTEGGVGNLCHGLMYVSDRVLSTSYQPPHPQKVEKIGIYTPAALAEDLPTEIDTKEQLNLNPSIDTEVQSKLAESSLLLSETVPDTATEESLNLLDESDFYSLSHAEITNAESGYFFHDEASDSPSRYKLRESPKTAARATHRVGIIFYRAHYLSGNTTVIDAIAAALKKRNLIPVPIYVSSLKEPEVQQALVNICQREGDRPPIDLLLNTTSFAITGFQSANSSPDSAPNRQKATLWQRLDVPILQLVCSGSSRDYWRDHPQGLTPRDIAMNVALPEVDGRIITRAISFKAAYSAYSETRAKLYDYAQPSKSRTVEALKDRQNLQTDVVIYQPESDRIDFVADLALKWVQLRHTPAEERKIALILANYPNRDGRMANGVGLDTPASCLEILRSLQQAGYTVTDLPATSDALMAQLATGVTNDPEGHGLRAINQTLSIESYQSFFQTLSPSVQSGVVNRWGEASKEWQRFNSPRKEVDCLPISGIQFGNVFVGIQPSRGYDIDPSLNYHAPDLEPTHAYLGFYHWLRTHFGTQAVVHVGKHGNLEWLPGKGIALSSDCYPEAALGAMPHFYPFIVNDPGEGAQAKRRSAAVILDHLTPPMARAELYGPLQQLESLVDEYYEAQNLDPTRLKIIGPKILDLLKSTQIQREIGLSGLQVSAQALGQVSGQTSDLQTWLPQLDGYLCELKEAQIRDGLHIFGQCPTGNQLRDLVVAIARHPSAEHIGLSRAVAETWQLDLDPLTADPSIPYESIHPQTKSCRTIGDVIEQIENYAADLVGQIIESPHPLPLISHSPSLAFVLTWIAHILLPNLRQTTHEITHLIHGLNGSYIPSGPSGAPTRNRPDVLPTGRNFYSVDIRAIPTESAWDVGRKAAEILIENYTQEQGEYPQTLGLSMWGTSAMRTGGDDIAEALALLGVRPVWDGPSRRVVDFEILPLSMLGRPRVDVTLRVSGFFRDAFPNLISLFDQAVTAVASLDEPADQNPLAAQVQKDYEQWQSKGLNSEQSAGRSRYRIFGSKPGAYGAGLQGLIEAQNWESDADLARAYINWSSYAYTAGKGGNADGHSAPEAFSQRLENMQIVLQNQDNREHDLLDSDDYYQFQGGLTAAVKARRGEAPVIYFGDNAVPENPKVRSLQAEIARVYRSRVINPKWIKGVMRHGYKGAFEMAATVDYLFAYDATTSCVADHMYTGVAEAYVFDSEVRDFVEKSNPWALRDMAERLLEANQRGLWKGADERMVDRLRAIAHEAEGQIEAGLSSDSF